jgi:hypothetical protein
MNKQAGQIAARESLAAIINASCAVINLQGKARLP